MCFSFFKKRARKVIDSSVYDSPPPDQDPTATSSLTPHVLTHEESYALMYTEVTTVGIGRRIKEAREQAGLTQEQLGKMIGVTGSAITNYEKETSHPKEPVMYALINALGVDANFLFQDCVKNAPSDTDRARNERERLLLRKFRDLNKQGREYIFLQLDIASQIYSGECADLPVVEDVG